MAQCLYQLNGIQQEFENSEVFGFMLSSKSNHLVRWCISVSWFTYEWQIEYVAHHKDLMEFIFAVSRKRQIAIVDQMTPVLPQTVILCELLPFFSKQFFC
jgi:ABC-type antimicrobial peptide transport system permease subunit